MVINTNKYVYNVFLKMCVIFQHLKSISASQTNGTGLSKKKKNTYFKKNILKTMPYELNAGYFML